MTALQTMRELKAHFVGLANPTRLAIIAELAQGDATGSELARRLKLSQPLLSWHLRVMRRAALINTRRVGRELLCSLDRAGIRASQERFNHFIGLPATQPSARVAGGGRDVLLTDTSKETANAI